MMALSGHAISGDVYAWSAVFILPINSALNPILYTASAIIGRTTFNPSTDEQTRTDLSMELGSYIKEYRRISRQLSTTATRKNYKSIEDILEGDVKIFASAMLKSSFEIFRCLDILHRAFLVMGKIDKTSVCISARNGELTGDVILTKEPASTTKKEDLRNDILQTGKVLSALIKECTKPKDDTF